MTAKTKTAAKNKAPKVAKASVPVAPAPGVLPSAIDVTVPLNKLVLSPRNVRKVRTEEGIPELAAQLESVGQLHRLSVTDAGDGYFAVEAGGRRLQGFNYLLTRGRIAPDAPIDCRLHELANARAVSLAENSHLPMHPADEFLAYSAMAEESKSIADIALHFGVSELTVKRRLKLARVAPRFIDMYRAKEISGDMIQTLALVDDHELQCRAFDGLSQWSRNDAHGLRRALSQDNETADSRIARFVGLKQYEDAGGAVLRDLFAEPGKLDGIFLEDLPLLHTLADAKLRGTADGIEAEGWKWVDFSLNQDWRETKCSREAMGSRELTADEQQALTAIEDGLEANEVALEAYYDSDEEDTDEAQEKARALEAEIEALNGQHAALREGFSVWTGEQKVRAGVLVHLDYSGTVQIVRGLVRPEDKKAVVAAMQEAGEAVSHEMQRGVRAEYSEKHMRNMTAHRTGALQAAMTKNPHVALVTTVYAMASRSDRHLIQIVARGASHATLCELGSEFAESQAGAILADAESVWCDRLPGDDEALFAWLLNQDTVVLLDLLAYYAARSVHAIESTPRTFRNDSDRLAEALGVDMADWWQATPANFFGHVSKAKGIEVVAQATGNDATKEIGALKKAEAAEHAAAKVAGHRWLPTPLQAKAKAE